MIDIELTGADQLATQLLAYQASLERRVDGALLALAQAIKDNARANVLRQRAPERGLPSALADSLFVRADGTSILVGASAPHATIVEFGTVNQPAEPFLFPAVLAAQDQLRPLLGATRLP
ncbi:MAG: hypothetical protein Tsb0016_25120 [Sphingomonadales bacterium]